MIPFSHHPSLSALTLSFSITFTGNTLADENLRGAQRKPARSRTKVLIFSDIFPYFISAPLLDHHSVTAYHQNVRGYSPPNTRCLRNSGSFSFLTVHTLFIPMSLTPIQCSIWCINQVPVLCSVHLFLRAPLQVPPLDLFAV